LLAACALVLAAASAGAATPSAKQLTLRLPDVPGYAIERTGPGDTCSVLNFVSDVPRDILQLERRVVTGECTVLLEHMWTASGAPRAPTEVLSAAFRTTAESGAAALLDRPRGTVASVAALPRPAWTVDRTPATIGEQTVLLHAPGSAGFDDEGPTVAVLWRSAPAVGLVAVTGLRRDAGERIALRLAAVQQARIATPTPLIASDFDDTEVGLHDPRLDVPVWWTSRDFEAPHLRHVRLLSSVSAEPDHRRHGERVTLTYGLNKNWPAFEIMHLHPSIFERRHWRRLLREVEHDRCIRVQRFEAPAGTATLYTGRRHCRTDLPTDPPVAIVRRPDVVLMIGCSACYAVQRRYYPLQHYASAAATRAIVRALRPREPSPDASAAP